MPQGSTRARVLHGFVRGGVARSPATLADTPEAIDVLALARDTCATA